MSGENSVSDAFIHFQDLLDKEQDVKEGIRLSVKELEELSRCSTNILQKIHHIDGLNKVDEVCEKCTSKLTETQFAFKALESKFSSDCYYKYNDHWKFIVQRLSFLAAFNEFLKTGSLISHEECSRILGVYAVREQGFHLELEDYLGGLLLLANELARLSTNAVTSGHYEWSFKIAKFVAQLESGFRLLNLKNDWLRKRYDGLKYDLKKVEEIVYDISVRGLKPRGS